MVHTTALTVAAAALLAALPVDAGLYSKNSPVLQIDGKNYDRLIAQSNHTSIVEFYAPWCGHCKNLQPAYEKAAASLAGLAKVAAVDCDEDANKAFCGGFGVQGFPTLKIVKPGKTPGKPIVEDYQGPRTAKGIYEAVSDKIPNLVTKVEDKNLEKWLEDSSKKTKAILFTDKGRTSALLKAVAVDFKGSIEIAQIRNTAKASGELFGISEYPTLLLLPGGKEATEGIPFNGELTKENIVEFLSQAASPNPDPAPPKAKISKLKNAKKEDKSKADFESASSAHAKADASDAAASATDETMEEEATESPEPIVETEKPIVLPPAPQLEILESETQLIAECMGSRTGTCILALLPSSPDETATQAIVSLSEVAHNHHTHQRALFPFYIVPETNPAYAQIQTSLSLTGFEVIAINGKRGWWRPLPQDVTAESIETWVDSIRLGEGTKQKIPAGLIPEELEAEPTIVEDGPEVAEETVIVEPVEEETVQSAEAHDEL